VRAEAEQGRFRQDRCIDLMSSASEYRRFGKRPEDVPPLARHFWTIATTRVNTQATLLAWRLEPRWREYHWPGNVRELQNVMAALAVEAPARGQVTAALACRQLTHRLDARDIGRASAKPRAPMGAALRRWSR
jgi:DNA-binding NtrC family response regulator